jgi:hypothetical protein
MALADADKKPQTSKSYVLAYADSSFYPNVVLDGDLFALIKEYTAL